MWGAPPGELNANTRHACARKLWVESMARAVVLKRQVVSARITLSIVARSTAIPARPIR